MRPTAKAKKLYQLPNASLLLYPGLTHSPSLSLTARFLPLNQFALLFLLLNIIVRLD
jgi:hypothetical protein